MKTLNTFPLHWLNHFVNCIISIELNIVFTWQSTEIYPWFCYNYKSLYNHNYIQLKIKISIHGFVSLKETKLHVVQV